MAHRRDMGDVRRLGWALQTRREREGVTRAQLAQIVGIAQAELAEIESGKIDPPLSLMCKLGSAIGWVIR